MAFGPGKYDDLATVLREETRAAGVVVIVFDGAQGSGFSAQLSPDLTLTLPSILRDIARRMESEGWARA